MDLNENRPEAARALTILGVDISAALESQICMV